MILHVVTAITRPENLPRICSSLSAGCVHARCDLVWHWRHDFEHAHVGGQKPKNDALDVIKDGWVWFLDDDTLADARIPSIVASFDDRVEVDAFVVSQRRADGYVLAAGAEHVRVGSIDIGQAIIRRSAIGTQRIPETYVGDGVFLEAVLPACNTVYLPLVASSHNALAA